MPLPTNADLLSDFLDHMHWVMPNLNDTFGYATADSEKIYMDQDTNQEMLVDVWSKYGHIGIVAYVAKMRGTEPLPQLLTPAYYQAREHLTHWNYEPD